MEEIKITNQNLLNTIIYIFCKNIDLNPMDLKNITRITQIIPNSIGAICGIGVPITHE